MAGIGFVEQPNLIQTLMAVWIPEKGWLVTKRGMIYGGHHGPAPMLDEPTTEEIVAREAKTSLRAIRSRLKAEGL